ncbi:MAG: ATP-dependent Clp protease ATP-binding subunit [Candidatus Magasanikiibacteriota bacterium]
MNPEQLLERFSTHLRTVVAKAMALATSLSHDKVTPAHLFVVLLEETGSIANEILSKLNIKSDFIYKILDNKPELVNQNIKIQTATLPELNIMSKKILEKSMLLAYERNHTHIGTEHLLLGMIYSTDKDIKDILHNFKINISDIEEEIENILQSTSKFPDIDDVSNMMDQIEGMVGGDNLPPMPLSPPPMNQIEQNQTSRPKMKRPNITALDLFTNNLTNPNNQKNIDPVIGREREIERVINILARRTKNNPVLIGEPGVGKTAIVEGLARRITEGDVPDVLKRKKILSLDLTLMLAGTIYRGEFEARLKQVIDEVTKSPDCILFIDELHNIIGAGSSQGAMDAANILKPALARGSLRCIGATTIDEYKKHVSHDPALERRFQAINVEEPSKEETEQILQGIKKYYENFHNVKITDEAITTAVELSTKYIHDNFLPDKAIDLLDEASAAIKVKNKLSNNEIKREKLLDEIDHYNTQKEESIRTEKFDDAMTWKKRLEGVNKKLQSLDKIISKAKQPIRKKVMGTDVAKILETKLNIQANILLQNEWDELATLPDRLKQSIIGQDEAVNKIVKSLKQSYLGLKDSKKPLASFAFIGPSGVGKTEMAKILAKELYHDDKALIKLDMSEFSEQHSTSKLLGSPAGYIGHKERNHFTDEIRKRPYCVVLFDEVDKAHADVAKLLLQILDEGELTDSAGKKTHFHHAVIILTTNLGAELFKTTGIGFGKVEADSKDRDKSIVNKLKEDLSPALINRLDNVVIFNPLTEADIKNIVAKNLKLINEKLQTNNKLSIKATNQILLDLSQDSFNVEEGARQVERILQNIIQEAVIEILKKPPAKQNYSLVKKAGKYELV